eukprot:226305-Pyramimonas_sp.AAC.1
MEGGSSSYCGSHLGAARVRLKSLPQVNRFVRLRPLELRSGTESDCWGAVVTLFRGVACPGT